MPKKKTTRPLSWAAKYSDAGYATSMGSGAYSKELDDAIKASEERTARLQEEIKRAEEQRKATAEEKYKQHLQEEQEAIEERAKKRTIFDVMGSHGTMNVDYDTAPLAVAGQQIYNATHRDPHAPEGYDYNQLRKDWWNKTLEEMNNAQAGSFEGLQLRGANLQNHINGYKRSLQNRQERDELIKQRAQIQQQINPKFGFNWQNNQQLSQEEADAAIKQLSEINQKIAALDNEYKGLAESRQFVENMAPKTLVGQAWDWATEKAPDWYTNNSIVGKTTPFHDQINDATRFLGGIGDINKSYAERIAQLDKATEKLTDLQADWQAGIEQNKAEAAERRNKVSQYFQDRSGAGDIRFFDPDQYLFRMPNLIGASNSSWHKQLPAMIVGLATGVGASALASAGMGAAAYGTVAAGSGLAFGMNYSAGVDENTMEVAENTRERIKNELSKINTKKGGKDSNLYVDIINEAREKVKDINPDSAKLPDNDLLQLVMNGIISIDNPNALKTLDKAISGVENLFRRDMAAVTWDAAVDTFASTLPFNRIAGGSKLMRATKEAIKANPALAKIAESRFGKEVIDGLRGAGGAFARGSIGGPVTGAANVGLHLVLNPLEKKMGALGNKLASKIASTAKAATTDEAAELLARTTKKGITKQYIKDIAGRQLLQAGSEGIEEYKQWNNAQDYAEGKLDNRWVSFGEMALDDFLGGVKGSALTLSLPFEDFMSESNKEAMQQIKGGILGQLFNLQTHVSMLSSVRPYVQEIKAADAVMNNFLAGKMEFEDAYEKGQNYARSARQGGFSANPFNTKPTHQQVADAFNRVREENEKYNEVNGEYGVDPEMLNQEEERYKNVVNIALDPLTRVQAKNQGIDYNSEDYDKFVSLKAWALDKNNESMDALNAARENLETYIQGNQYHEDDVAEDYEGEILYQSTLARLAALFQVREQTEIALQANQNNPNPKVKRGLKKQLDFLNSQINSHRDYLNIPAYIPAEQEGYGYVIGGDQKVNTADDVEKLVYDHTTHSELTQLQRDVILREMDVLHSQEVYKQLVGEMKRKDGEGNVVDIKEEDNFNPRTSMDKVAYEGGKAQKIMSEIDDIRKQDEDFEEALNWEYQKMQIEQRNEQSGMSSIMTIDPGLKGIWDRITSRETPEQEQQRIDTEFAESMKSLLPMNAIDEILERGRVIRDMNAIRQRSDKHEAAARPDEDKNPVITPEDPVPQDPEPNEPATPKKVYEKPDIALENRNILAENSEQQSMRNKLQEKRARDAQEIMDDEDGYHTTSHDYFINLNGKVHRASRVHSVMPEAWLQDTSWRKNNKEMREKTTLKELVEYLHSQETEKNKKSVEAYIKYLQDNWDSTFSEVARNNPENRREYDTTLEHAAKSLYQVTSPSIKVGNVNDEINRYFFGDRNVYNNIKYRGDEAIREIFSMVSPSEKKSYALIFDNNFDIFKQYIQGLMTMQEEFDKNGWVVDTNRYVWHAEYAAVGLVAGETDMIAVDQQGNIQIIDFKTTKSLNNFSNIFNPARQNLTQEQDYTNQQNIYAMLIADEVSAEVRGLHLLFTIVDYTGSYQTGELSRILSADVETELKTLTLSDEMRERLSNAVDNNNKEQLLEDVTNNLKIVNDRLEEINSGVDDYIFVALSEPARQELSDINREVLNITVDIRKITDNTDVSEIDAINARISRLQNQLDPLEELLKAEVARIAEEDALTQQAAAEEATKHKPIEDNQEPGIAQAENKRNSVGNQTRTNLHYKDLAANRELANATNEGDFLQTAQFELFAEGDNVYCNITYKGKQFKHILVDTKYRGQWTENGKNLFDKIQQLSKQLKPGQKIVAINGEMNRTKGRILHHTGANSQKPAISTDLFSGQDIYNVDFNKNGNVGYSNGQQVQVIDGSPIYTFDQSERLPGNGALIYVKRVPRNEMSTNPAIPVTLDRIKLTKQSDIDFLINAILSEDIDKPIVYKGINLGATARQFANLLIPVVDDTSRLSGIASVVRDTVRPGWVYIMNRDSVASGTNRGTFNLLDPKGKEDFIKAISQLSIAERHDVLQSRLGKNQSKPEIPFYNLRNIFANNDIDQIKITDTLVFDKEDFKMHISADGSVKEGLSGLGWYVKHGIITTDYAGLDHCNVEIKGVTVIDQVPEAKAPNTDANIIQKKAEYYDTIQTGLDAVLACQWTEKDRDKIKLTEEEAKRHLRRIFGDRVDDPEFIRWVNEDFIKIEGAPANVVGACWSDGILLSNMAYESVDWHEAFHRVFELLINPKTRDAQYKKRAKRLGLDIENDPTNMNKRAVAESFADQYQEYMLNRKHSFEGDSWFSRIAEAINSFIGGFNRTSSWQLARLFALTNFGFYKNKTVSKAQRERFNRIYGILYKYKINGAEFEHVLNAPMYDTLKNTIVYAMILGNNVDHSGANIQKLQITKEAFMRGINVFLTQGYDLIGQKTKERSVGQLAMNELYEKFDYIADDIAAAISDISTDYRKIAEEEEEENRNSDEVAESDFGEHTKASYEFNRFDKTSSRVRFFFSTIPSQEFRYRKQGNEIIKERVPSVNYLGLPEYVNTNYAFNDVLNNVHDIDTVDELLERLKQLAEEDPMYGTIYSRIQKISDKVYKDGKFDANQEAFLSQLMKIIRSNKLAFKMVRSSLNSDKTTYTLTLQDTDSDYNADIYTKQWGMMLSTGATQAIKLNEKGNLVFNPNSPSAVTAFQRIHDLFDSEKKEGQETIVGIKQLVLNAQQGNPRNIVFKTKVLNPETGKYENKSITNLNNPGDIETIKDKIVDALNYIGVGINRKEFDFMLRNKYNTNPVDALSQMFSSTKENDSMTSFLSFLASMQDKGKLNITDDRKVMIGGKFVNIELAYAKMAFLRDLANWKYTYRHQHDQLTVLAVGGNKFYEISDNNYISDVARSLNKRDEDFQDLKNDVFVYLDGGTDRLGKSIKYGSLIIKTLDSDPNARIQVNNFVGFKTDKKGDYGQDYFEIQRREDYVSKILMLEQGGIIGPTFSDKKNYIYITGVKLPGLDYSDPTTLGNQKVIVPDGKTSIYYQLTQREDVIDQMISYAMTEYESVKRGIEQLETVSGNPDSQIENYHTKEQCARFASLLGVYQLEQNAIGKTVEIFHSFNNKKRTPKQNLEDAEKYFFGSHISNDERRAKMARLLSARLSDELKTAEELGLIVKRENANTIQCPYLRYKNAGLNKPALDAIHDAIVKANPGITMDEESVMSLAIAIYMNDISNKAIMSGQETERVFSGNPAFYEWKYDDSGNLIDRTVNELKRLGGMNSTGDNNFMDLKQVPEQYIGPDGKFTGEYVCAEIKDSEVASQQVRDIEAQSYRGELTRMLYKRAAAEGQDRHEFIDGATLEELEADAGETLISIAKAKAKEVSQAYESKINVADGAAYISDTMAEMLLRMNGVYSKEIEEAFRILREETTSNMLQKLDAYQKIVTKVIGTQKYTAFGRRKYGDALVTYYNKYALFPLFKCMATGKTFNLYEKMKTDKIDMLMFSSGVKVGSQGAKNIDWSHYRQDDDENNANNYQPGKAGDPAALLPSFAEGFTFNTYKQKFKYLRKQLNTDPKEEALMSIKTQSLKVAFSTLIPKRIYTTQDGRTLSGEELRDDIMKSINELSDRGLNKVMNKYFTKQEDGTWVADAKKFSEGLLELMSSRGADETTLHALQVDKDGNLEMPLSAVSTSSFIESSLISQINKDVIDINTAGAAFIQRSSYGIEGPVLYRHSEGSILSDADLPQSINGGKKLLMINEEGSMDCVLSIDFFDKILKHNGQRGIPEVPIKDKDGNDIFDIVKDENGEPIVVKDKDGKPKTTKDGKPIYKRKQRTRKMSFTEARAWLINRGLIGPNATANIMAYRVPTQAQSSIHALRCVDVIPVVNDTVILPEEFTKITGSDFDIDKLYLSAITFQVKREKGDDGKYHQIVTDQFEENSSEYYQNKLLRNYLAILMDKDENGVPRSTNILHRPIDNDTDLLKNVLKKIEAKVGVSAEKPYAFYSLTTQTRAKNDYITGKIGIGPFALNNNNHILTMLYGVKFADGDNIMSKLGLLDLSNDEDKDGNQILSWISGLINAHVDIAKDPYISRMNVNPFTYNLVNLLVRTGFGENTFFFINQPIIKQIARAYNNASSMYMQDQYSTKYYVQRDAVLNVVLERFKNVTLPGISKPLDQLISPTINKATKIQIQNMFKQLVDSGSLEAMATQQNPKNSNLTFEQAQLVCYLAYVQFEPYAQAISNLVKYTKIDTKKHGKSLIEQDMYLQGFNKLFSNDNSLFEKDGLRRLRDESYVGHKTELAINTTKNVLAGHTLESTPQFLDAVHRTLEFIGRKDSLDSNLAKKVSRVLSASIKATFFNDYARSISINPHYMHDLVSNSRDDVSFTTNETGNEIVLGKTNHPLSSYIGKKIYIWYNSVNGPVGYDFTIIGVNEESNSVYINNNIYGGIIGTASLMDGENTIYDRWARLAVKIKTDPKYADLLDGNGEFVNRLLRELVPGNVYDYKSNYDSSERPDTYETLKFVRLFNASDDQNSSHTYISQAWDELLNDNAHPDVQEFARDLVVYAFITSGDQQGFTKIFKYVPASWREESGYAEYIQNKINEMLPDIPGNDITDIYDAVLNNWYDNDLVRTYSLKDRITKANNFIVWRKQVKNAQTGVIEQQTSYPFILAAIRTNPQTGAREAFIDPENAPRFIKIPRRTDFGGRYESQRRYTVYQLIDIAKNAEGTEYPVYVKVNPKGNQINLKFTITEYGRSDAYTAVQEDTVTVENMKKVYDTADRMSVEKYNEYKYWYGQDYADIVFDLNREVVDTVFGAPVPEQLRAQVESSSDIVKTIQQDGKIRLSLESHTDERPRQIVIEPQGDNKYYIHLRIWDGEKIPGNISNEDKQKLFDALYEELPDNAEILFPKSGENYYATRGTVAALQRISRDARFKKGNESGVLKYIDKDGSVKEFSGTSFIKKPLATQEQEQVFELSEEEREEAKLDKNNCKTNNL